MSLWKITNNPAPPYKMNAMERMAIVSSIPLQTLQHLSFKVICSDSEQLSSGHGSPGAVRRMLLSCDGQRETIPVSSSFGPIRPTSLAKDLDGILKGIIHLLCFLSPSLVCVHDKPITR